MSSLPMPAQWAPWPVNINPIEGSVVLSTGIASLEARASSNLIADDACTAVRHLKCVRLCASLYDIAESILASSMMPSVRRSFTYARSLDTVSSQPDLSLELKRKTCPFVRSGAELVWLVPFTFPFTRTAVASGASKTM